MNPEDIIPELHRHREQLARACGFNVKKLMDHYREREALNPDRSHRLVSFVKPAQTEATPVVLRDAPSKKRK
jgi:hypothetical protein